MMRFEKTVKGLESIHAVALDKEQLYVNNMSMKDFNELLADALDLLKEREPVKTEPVRFRVVRAGGLTYPFWDCVCDGCGFKTSEVHTNWRFCPNCGRAVKWE